MMPVFSWSFPQFEVAKSEDGLTDVVKVIHWRYDASEGPYNAGSYGTVSLGAPDQSDFTPYKDLTEAWAIKAVSDSIDVAAIEANLTGQIEKDKNPPVVPMSPPWDAQG